MDKEKLKKRIIEEINKKYYIVNDNKLKPKLYNRLEYKEGLWKVLDMLEEDEEF